MIEHNIKVATCGVSCGNESGTGWLITKDRVITARHCVLPGLAGDESVKLFFPDRNDAAVPAKIIAEPEETDVCLLSIEITTAGEALPTSFERPREGEIWQAFGYPQSKATLGHRLS